jgi:hypothetical protein
MSLLRNKRWWAATLLAGALVFQALPSGCAEYYTNATLASFNWCSVFNCEGGAYFDLCNPFPLFFDCPQLQEATQS